MKKIILIISIVVLVFIIFFSSLFIKKSFLTSLSNFLNHYFKTDFYKENISLKLENENLKAQIQKGQIFAQQDYGLSLGKKYFPARIFSTYPFNVKDVLIIDKGLSQGVKKGMTAVLDESILIGQVNDVFENSSNVRTVFDPDWQISVKIGEEKINGFFQGGNEPKITLIEKEIKVGDPVFTASKDFPLDLKIGEIKEIREKTKGVFQEAVIEAPYNVNELESIYLVKE